MAKHLAVRQQNRATSETPSETASNIEQNGAVERLAGRKRDATKVWYLFVRIIKDGICDDSGPTKSDSEDNHKIRAAGRAAGKTHFGWFRTCFLDAIGLPNIEQNGAGGHWADQR